MTSLRRGAAIGALLLAAACSDDDDGTGPNLAGTMTAQINGVSWSASTAVSATLVSGSLNIAGHNSQALQIQLQLLNVSGPGTFAVGAGSTSYAQVSEGVTKYWNSNSANGSGSVTVTELTATHITGTFSFVAIPTISITGDGNRTVTNGAFSIDRTQ